MRLYGQTTPWDEHMIIGEKEAEMFLNDKYTIKTRTRQKHDYNPDTGQYDKLTTVVCGIRKLYITDEEPLYILGKEVERIQQTQRKMAKILDQRCWRPLEEELNSVKSVIRAQFPTGKTLQTMRQYKRALKADLESLKSSPYSISKQLKKRQHDIAQGNANPHSVCVGLYLLRATQVREKYNLPLI